MFALVDCNNFYASCERLFRPDLRDKPIVVLSNNDGCVIARSNEAKALGIAMGEPFFKVKSLCRQHGIQVFSSNYTLYGDMSQRVMSVIEAAWPQVEVYSIDEAFLDLRSMPAHRHDEFCQDLRQRILKFTGIPTSIGIGPTKTLAKLANHICKKELKIPTFNIDHQRQWLDRIEVGEVWGVGRRWQKKLMAEGIYSAGDLAAVNAPMIRKKFNVVLMRTAMELQGINCDRSDEAAPRHSIMSSRSFGSMQTHFSSLAEAVSSHCARACEKARQHGLLARRVYVFVRSNPHRGDLAQYTNSMDCGLLIASNDTRVITRAAKECLKRLFKAGVFYKKVGVMLEDLIDQSQQQLNLFYQPEPGELLKQGQLMGVLDAINRRFGSHTIKLAAEGYNRAWAMQSNMRSPCYTTRWSDLPVVRSG
ncbi:Y-family DNA polymerase [Legionella sp. CNM-4043-24]|uniref:Y-family DNA polymerase n=1 Tax=Legionella sp. CNM-4043-24 TaxID=3421646 RepID=UPI00403ADDD1